MGRKWKCTGGLGIKWWIESSVRMEACLGDEAKYRRMKGGIGEILHDEICKGCWAGSMWVQLWSGSACLAKKTSLILCPGCRTHGCNYPRSVWQHVYPQTYVLAFVKMSPAWKRLELTLSLLVINTQQVWNEKIILNEGNEIWSIIMSDEIIEKGYFAVIAIKINPFHSLLSLIFCPCSYPCYLQEV